MKVQLSKKDELIIETFKKTANGGKPFTGIRFRIGKRKPKTLFHMHHGKALNIIDALKDCLADIDTDNGSFYESPAWQQLRYETLKRDRKCCLCGSVENLHCDHIMPRSLYPELELDPENTQTLCKQCNIAKSNRDCEDYR